MYLKESLRSVRLVAHLIIYASVFEFIKELFIFLDVSLPQIIKLWYLRIYMYVPTILAPPLLIVNDMCYGVTVEPSAAGINA